MKPADTRTIKGLLAGRPAALLLFHTVRHFIESLGPVTVEATKIHISFGTARKFARVRLPQLWIKAQPDSGITLSVALDRCVIHDRIRQAVEPYLGRWMHHVVTSQESDHDLGCEGMAFQGIYSWPARTAPLPGILTGLKSGKDGLKKPA